MSIADDLEVLDEWAEQAPQEAAHFTAALQRRYPQKGPEDALLQFAIDRPDLYRNMVTELSARFAKTTADLERAIGAKVLKDKRLEAARQRLDEYGVDALSDSEREMLAIAGDLEIRITNQPEQQQEQSEGVDLSKGIDLRKINAGL